jgi:uncharacterized protein (DUF697 family)
MNTRKKLPKAIVPSSRENGLPQYYQDRSPSAAMGEPAAVVATAGAASDGGETTAGKAATTLVIANDLGPLSPRPDSSFESRHRSRARAIVERHANFSAIGGVIPLPLVNLASVTAIILRMLKLLSRHYGVPFERERARMIVVGLTGGCMPTGLAAVTASTLSFAVPGSALFGLAVCSVTASACTRGIGRMFIELFESGATWRDLPTLESR